VSAMPFQNIHASRRKPGPILRLLESFTVGPGFRRETQIF
jgi:hypothetical protein